MGPTRGEQKGACVTEEERRTGDAEDNMRDELDEAAERGRSARDASAQAVEEEEQTGGTGSVKDNVEDELDESQER
jgi:hypothetical protein